MRRYLRDLLDAVQGLVQVLALVAEYLSRSTADAVAARVEDLERSRSLFEGRVEATLEKVDARFNAIRASEERTRALSRRVRAQADEGDPDSESPDLDAIRSFYAQAGAGRAMQPVRNGVAEGDRPSAKDRKWGRV